MSGSIRLHDKYGVNPTIPLCFWCHKEKNEVALLGAAFKGEAPRNIVLDYEPCDACVAERAKGVTIVEASRDPEGGMKPTGRWVVITDDAVARLFQPETVVAGVLAERMAAMEPEAFGQLFARSMGDSSAANNPS